MEDITNQMINETMEQVTVEPVCVKSKPGRKRKYNTEEERKEARRQQNRAYRERKRKQLIEQRRAESNKSNACEAD